MNIKIVTDSTLDATAEEISKLGITVVPLAVTIDGQAFLDGIDLTPAEFLSKMVKAKHLPKTSQPPVGRFTEVYDELGEDGSRILSIHMTSDMSGTYESARQAAKLSAADVTVIDSRYISRALFYQVKKAAQLAEEGYSIEDIVKRLAEVRAKTKLYILVDTLDNLKKGGRIGKLQGLLGSLLHIKPIANLDSGALTPVTKVRSSTKALRFFTERLQAELSGKQLAQFSIVHAGGSGETFAEKLKQEIVSITGFEDIDIHVTTPVISTHAGIGAVGVMYQTT